MKKHKYYDFIVAWAEGYEIEYLDDSNGKWLLLGGRPIWREGTEYRIRDEYRELKQALKDGKTIQMYDDCEWVDVDEPFRLKWDRPVSGYRIKPEPKYQPFVFTDAKELIGRVVKPTCCDIFTLIVQVQDNSVLIGGGEIVYFTDLLEKYVFLGGEKCGKLV